LNSKSKDSGAYGKDDRNIFPKVTEMLQSSLVHSGPVADGTRAKKLASVASTGAPEKKK